MLSQKGDLIFVFKKFLKSLRRNHTILGNRTVCASNDVITCVGVPQISARDRIYLTESNRLPLRSGTIKLNIRQRNTRMNRRATYARYAIGNNDTRQTGAPGKRTIINGCDSFSIIGSRNYNICIGTSSDIVNAVTSIILIQKKFKNPTYAKT